MPLSTKQIDKLVREAKSGRFPKTAVHDEHGMYLSRDLNSWLQRVTVGGKRRWMGLGARSSVSLAEARELARKARGLAATGTDPIEARKVERAASVVLSVDAAMAHYFKTHSAEWRSPKTRLGFEHLCRDHITPVIGKLGVAALTYTDVLRVLQPHWATKTTSMVRLRGWLFLSLESTRGKPGGLTEEQRNCADWKRLKHDLASPRKISKPEHHPAMEWTLVPAFMARLRDIDGLIARTLEFGILTAVRLYPVRAMRWREVDLDAAIWTIPGPKEKSGVEHRVPLSYRAVQILREVRPDDARSEDYVFHGIKGRRHMQCDLNGGELMKRMGVHGLTVHGFRSSFRDWAGEATHHDADIAEAALSHRFGGTRGSYQRGDLFSKRRVLMVDWDRYCAGVVELEKAA